jgi:hypothetical protein
MSRRTGKPITYFDITELFGQSHLEVQTGAITVNGFKETEIFSMNLKKVISLPSGQGTWMFLPRKSLGSLMPQRRKSIRIEEISPVTKLAKRIGSTKRKGLQAAVLASSPITNQPRGFLYQRREVLYTSVRKNVRQIFKLLPQHKKATSLLV